MTVYVVTYEHRHGIDVAVYATPELASGAVADIAREYWADEWDTDWPAPQDPAGLSDAEVTSVYFDQTADESWEITSCEIQQERSIHV